GLRRHHADPRPHLRGPADRYRAAGGSTHVRASARARSDRRARDAVGYAMSRRPLSLFDRALLGPASLDALRKLDPRVQWRNPVMFVVYIGSILTTALWLQALGGHGEAPGWFIFNIALWLWFTVLFANFAEALAEGRSKAQAEALRGLKQTVWARKLADPNDRGHHKRVRADDLRRGDVVLIEAAD